MRMMVVFEKGAELRYIGHLDLMRAMQRALRRSGLPIKYSNGFNPHIRLSFAYPLSVGVVGLRELMEVPMEDGVTPEGFTEGLNAALPGCLRVRECHAVGDDFPTLMSLVQGARYTFRFAKTPESEKAAEALDAFMALEECFAERRTKSGENRCDIRPFVKSAACETTEAGYAVSLETVLTQAGALKPALWLQSLCAFAHAQPFPCVIYREAILARDPSGALVPMEALAHA